MPNTGKSQQSEQKAVSMVAGLALSIALDDVPGFQLLQIGGILADLVDPFGYSSTLTRNAIDTYSQNAVTQIKTTMFSDQVKNAMASAIDKSGPNLTAEQKDEILAIQTAYWHLYELQPTNFAQCFGDFNTVGATSLSGPPTASCDEEYVKSYNEFITKNKEEYEKKEITSGDNLIDLLNGILVGELRFQTDNTKSQYLQTVYFFVGTIIALIIGVVIWFLYEKYIKKN